MEGMIRERAEGRKQLTTRVQEAGFRDCTESRHPERKRGSRFGRVDMDSRFRGNDLVSRQYLNPEPFCC
jgi:hypothetical protein